MSEDKRISLNNLKPNLSLKWHQILSIWYVENRFTYPLRMLIAKNDVLYSIVSKVRNFLFSRIINLRRLKHDYEKSLAKLSGTDQIGYELDSEYGYSGDVFANEILTAIKYRTQIAEDFPHPSESKRLYEHIIELSSNLLATHEIPTFLNFGVSYAYTDAILARKFPETKFVGIERTSAAKMINLDFTAEIKNLEMLSGDIFDLFSQRKFDGGVLFHSRTLLLMPQDFIRKLYKAAHEAGFRYIIGTEQYGISRQTGKPYEFSYEYQDSVVYRTFMYIHNWPNILEESGFELQQIESIKTDHPHEDYRIMSFLAKSF